ncbi:MlaD family protein [Maritimibacter dapengensis]|uniref:MCE family protein n=1 Tax=Maritimibacter dapengensis TaxID=2836868 RepID=A0ABS6SZ86_9RHOB|nr:MlaD family protein [Maritimibacter dapengensis]MBV7377671.1 MCE family protein [Maritimibacter dapengensis]
MTERTPSDMEVTQRTRSVFRNLSIFWAIPLIALGVSLFVAWQTWAERGARIEVSFENAGGIVPEESTLRFRDVTVGVVEDVSFSEDLDSIIVGVRVDRDIAESLPPDAEFWVVRPEVTSAGIQGLSTVLSGVYLQVAFEPQPGASASLFTGLEETPLVLEGDEGIRVSLRAPNANQINPGAPISFKGIEVGRIETPRLIDENSGVVVDAFIEAPYDELVTSATRFWVTSGISVDVGPRGLNFAVGSLSNIVRGGLAFGTVLSDGQPVSDGEMFDIFDSQDAARSSVFAQNIENAVELAVEFEESVNGLSAGSRVNYRGVTVGNVSTIAAYVVDSGGTPDVRLRANLSIDPARIGLDPESTETAVYDFFLAKAAEGLRAQLGWQSLFSQTLVVNLVEAPDAPPGTLTFPDEGAPVLPTIESDLPDVGATAEGLLARIDALPVEELIEQVIATLASVETFAADDDLREAPGAFVSLMDDARGIVSSEGAQALPGALRDAVNELTAITEQLRSADAVARVMTTLEGVETAAVEVAAFGEDMGGAAEELTALLNDLQTLTEKANALEVEEFLVSARTFLDEADSLLSSPDTQAIPETLNSALDEARGALNDLREGGLVDNANAAMASANDAAGAIEDAAGRLPELADRIDRVVREAERVVASYGGDSNFNRETVASLREVRAAAEALSKLARAIERNPNSLLFGR